MSGIRNILGRVSTQVSLIAILALGIFFFSTRPVDEIQDIEIAGNYAYLALGNHGIRILDVSNPDQPTQVGEFDTPGHSSGLSLKGNVLFVADGNNGLLVFDVSNPAAIEYLWRFSDPRDARDVAFRNNYAYIADGRSGLHILKAQQIPPSPENRYKWSIGGVGLKQVLTTGRYLYGIGTDESVRVFDIGNPTEAKAFNPVALEVPITDMVEADGRVYVSTAGQGIAWFDNPKIDMQAPTGVNTLDGRNILSLDIYAYNAYLGLSGGGINILNIANLNSIASIKSVGGIGHPNEVKYEDGFIYVADGRQGLRVLDFEDNLILNPIAGAGSQAGIFGSIDDVTRVENHLYLASCQQGLQILRLDDNHQIIGQNQIKDFAGCVAAVDSTNDQVALTIRNSGVHIYSIEENRDTPVYLQGLPTSGAANDVVIRDNYVYVASGTLGMEIFDWRLLENQNVAQVGFGDDNDAQSIVLYNNFAYLATGDGGLDIVNIEDPQNPVTVRSLLVPGYARSVAVHPAVSGGDGNNALLAFVAGGAANEPSGLWVFDVTDPGNARRIGSYSTAKPALDILVDGRSAYLLLENQGLVTLDVFDPTSPQRKWNQALEGDYAALYQSGRFVYISRKTQGLQVLRMDNIEAPQQVIDFSTGGVSIRDAVFKDRYIYAVDGSKGLWTIDISNPNRPSIVEFYDTPGEALSIFLSGSTLYIADGSKGFHVLSIQDPGRPSLVGSFANMQYARSIVSNGDYAYVANDHTGIDVFSVRNPANIEAVGTYRTRGLVLNMSIFGQYVYLAEGGYGLEIVKISNPRRPVSVEITSEVSLGNTYELATSPDSNRLFVADSERGLRIYDISNPESPQEIFHLGSKDRTLDIALMENIAFLADLNGGVRIISLATNEDIIKLEGNPTPVSKLLWVDLFPGDPLKSHLFVFGNQGGLGVFQVDRKYTLLSKGLYATPGRATLMEFIPGTTPNWMRSLEYGLLLVGGVIGYVLVYNLMLAMISGLILPIRTGIYSNKIFNLLKLFVQGVHGSAIFIEGGEPKGRNLKVQSPSSSQGAADQGSTQDQLLANISTGFVIIDATSAVVFERTTFNPGCVQGLMNALRKRHPRQNLEMRTAGPGIELSGFGERIRGVVDLRRQIRVRTQISAHTRDGIEVKCVVFALFTLGEDPDVLQVTYEGSKDKAENLRVIQLGYRSPDEGSEQYYRVQIVRALEDILDEDDKREIHRFVQSLSQEEDEPADNQGEAKEDKRKRRRKKRSEEKKTVPKGWRPYKYDDKRVFAAVIARPYDVYDEEHQDWTEIPAHIAVNIFREILSLEYYDNLFNPMDPQSYPIAALRTKLRNRMVNQGILAFRYIEPKDGSLLKVDQTWRESQIEKYPVQELKSRKVLRSRGIKVITSSFTELNPSSDDVLGRYMFEYWRAPRQREASITKAEYELEAMRLKTQARSLAQSEMALALLNILQDRENTDEALTMRLFQALDTVAANPVTRTLLPRDTIYLMSTLRAMFFPESDDDVPELPPP